MVDLKDRILQSMCPTVMVPAYSELEPLGKAGYRYLMARDGLFVEGKTAWGHFRMPLWTSPRPLPYGTVESVISVEGGAIPFELPERAFELATGRLHERLEWAGWITWNEEAGYEFLPLIEWHVSAASVTYERPGLPEGTHLVLDLHSHPFDMPAFSSIDDKDDTGGIHFSGVISFPGETGEPELSMRLCIEGYYFELTEVEIEALFSGKVF